MRKVLMAVMAVAAAGWVTTGCSSRSEVPAQRDNMGEARLDLAKAKQEQKQDITKAKVEERKDVAQVQQKTDEKVIDAQKNLADEQKNLAEAQARDRNAMRDEDSQRATGGSGMTLEKAEVVSGTIQATTDKSLTLIIPSEQNRLMRFIADEQVTVMRDNQPITLQSLKAGDEVRASYLVDEHGLRVLRSLDVTKMSAPHPAMLPQ